MGWIKECKANFFSFEGEPHPLNLFTLGQELKLYKLYLLRILHQALILMVSQC